MSPPQVPNTDQAGPELVTITLEVTQHELIEFRRGAVQRMSVARSNMGDGTLSPAGRLYWYNMYDVNWKLYQKLLQAVKPPHLQDVIVPKGDEFDYLSQEV